MKLAVLSAADGAAWEERLVTAFDGATHPVAIGRRCVDVLDLLAVAESGQGRAALVAAGLRRLDVAVVERLTVAGVAVVGMAPHDDEAAEVRLRACGVTHIVRDDADPAVVASVLLEAARVAPDQAAGRHAAGLAGTDQAAAGSRRDGADLPAAAPTTAGTVVAVWGPTGAPGRTTVAATLADELADLGCTGLLVDADVYGGTIAPLLGLLDESPGIAAACRQAASGSFSPAALAALGWQLTPRLRVLTGIPFASRWPELRPAAFVPLLTAARALVEVTVVDCAFCLETDEELSFDTVAPRRNGATLAVLDAADLVLVVAAADPVGMQRLVRGLDELRDAAVSTPTEIVLNRVRDGVIPGDSARELTDALERFTGRRPAALLPADGRALDTALARGRLLRETAPASPLRRAVRELAGALAGVDAGPGRGVRRVGLRSGGRAASAREAAGL